MREPEPYLRKFVIYPGELSFVSGSGECSSYISGVRRQVSRSMPDFIQV
jgi:hypothetical protein